GDGEVKVFVGYQVALEDQRAFVEVHLREDVLAVEGGGRLVIHRAGGRERELQNRVQVAVGGVLQAPGEAAGGFVTAIKRGAFFAGVLPERHFVTLRKEWILGDVM